MTVFIDRYRYRKEGNGIDIEIGFVPLRNIYQQRHNIQAVRSGDYRSSSLDTMGGGGSGVDDDHHDESSSWQEKAARAKRKHRPSLKNWEVDGLAYSFPNYANSILESKFPYRSFRLVETDYDDDDDDAREGGGKNNNMMTKDKVYGGGKQKKIMVEERRQSLECARRRHRSHRNQPNYTHNHVIADDDDNDAFNDNKDDNAEQQVVAYPVVLHASQTPPSVFHELYEAQCIPVIIRDIPLGYQHHHSHPASERGAMQARRRSSNIEEKKNDGNDSDSDAHNSNKNNHNNVNGYHPIPNAFSSSHTTTATEVQTEWPALHRWTLPSLSTDTTLLDRPFKVGEDDDGHAVHMKLRHFLQYMQHNHDDSPLYIFDATFDEDKRGAARLLVDYTVPPYFNEDLMSLVGERRRPPYRWFLVGPTRSGTTVHIDPLGTSAWNTLIVGAKRWVLFPPHVPKSVVKGSKLILPGEDDEAIHYFTTILPRMKRRAAAVATMVNNCRSSHGTNGGRGRCDGGGCKDLGGYANFECYEFTQYPGETVFIPHGWWHAVLNLTDTVGITQNYCSRRNFDAVWTQARSGRKKMSCSWLRKLDVVYPDLAHRARELNARDGYVMLEEDSPAERAVRRERKRAERRARKEEKERRKKQEGEDKNKRQDQDHTQNHKQKEKWGDHRIAERRRNDVEGAEDGEGDAIMREVSPAET